MAGTKTSTRTKTTPEDIERWTTRLFKLCGIGELVAGKQRLGYLAPTLTPSSTVPCINALRAALSEVAAGRPLPQLRRKRQTAKDLAKKKGGTRGNAGRRGREGR